MEPRSSLAGLLGRKRACTGCAGTWWRTMCRVRCHGIVNTRVARVGRIRPLALPGYSCSSDVSIVLDVPLPHGIVDGGNDASAVRGTAGEVAGPCLFINAVGGLLSRAPIPARGSPGGGSEGGPPYDDGREQSGVHDPMRTYTPQAFRCVGMP